MHVSTYQSSAQPPSQTPRTRRRVGSCSGHNCARAVGFASTPVTAASISSSTPPCSASHCQPRSWDGLRASPPSKLSAFATSSTPLLLASQASDFGGPSRATRAGRVRVPARSPVCDRRCTMYGPHRCTPRCRGCRVRVSARRRGLRIRASLLLRDSRDRSYDFGSATCSACARQSRAARSRDDRSACEAPV
jgi:hypothetical protein